MKSYRRYVSMYGRHSKRCFPENILCLDTDPPEVPYYMIGIKVLKYERAYSHNRPRPDLR